LKGEMIHQEHTKAPIWRPMAGRVVSVGFSGTYTDKSAEVGFTALVGKRSMRYDASLRLLVADDRVTTRTRRPDSSPDIGVQQQSSRGPLA
jgi:hypothetical protein